LGIILKPFIAAYYFNLGFQNISRFICEVLNNIYTLMYSVHLNLFIIVELEYLKEDHFQQDSRLRAEKPKKV